MKKTYKKGFGIITILTFIMNLLLPVSASYAAAPIMTISNLSADVNNCTQFTQNPISIQASISNIDPSQIGQLYYEIYNENTKITTVEKNNKAQQSGPNQVTFANVSLTQGQSDITLKFGSTSVVTSSPAYVCFTQVANIANLKINGDNFTDNTILPSVAQQIVTINGDSPNATEVSATVNNNTTTQYAQVQNGSFFFMAEDKNTPPQQQQSNFLLNSGDNNIYITAKNGTNTYNVIKHLIYDNGFPFVYNAQINELDASNNVIATHNLLDSPTINSSKVKITAKIKVDKDAGGVYKANTMSLVLNGLTGSPVDQVSIPSSVTLTTYGSKYDIFDYSKIIDLSSYAQKDIPIQFSFSGGQLTSSLSNDFTFHQQNATAAYIDSVSIQGGASLNAAQTNSINTLPLSLNITEYNADSFNVLVNNSLIQTVTTIAGQNTYSVTLTSQQLADGISTLEIVPIKSGSSNYSGEKIYTLNVTSIPYVIMNNIYNGMSIKSDNDLFCGATLGCISGRVENIDLTDPNSDVKISINGGEVSIKSQIQADRSFMYSLPSTLYDNGQVNTIIIKLFLNKNNVVPTSQTEYKIFKFSHDSPDFISLTPFVSGNASNFSQAQLPDMYVTSENYVRFTGKLNSAATQLTIKVKKKDETGAPLDTVDQVSNFSSVTHAITGSINDSFAVTSSGTVDSTSLQHVYVSTLSANATTNVTDFSTDFIKLMSTGDTIFEFTITNGTTTSTRTITLTRQPKAYDIISPLLTTNGKNLQANVNSNYVDIQINAENADSVTIGKAQAVKDTSTGTDMFNYELNNLRQGKNSVKFTVLRGQQKITGQFIVNYTNTPIDGAQYKTPLSKRMKVFDGNLELSFPKGTVMKRNVPNKGNPLVAPDRKILFGIADETDGRVDKFKHPTAQDFQASNAANIIDTSIGKQLLIDDTGRFRPASPLYWIDAGTIKDQAYGQSTTDYIDSVLNGGGQLPYDPTVFYTRNNDNMVVPSDRGTLTLHYNSSIRQDAWRYLSVEHFSTFVDYRGIPVSKWVNIGGVINTKKHTIQVPFDEFGYYRVMFMYRSFDDVIGHPWARNYLDTLYSKGIMKNKGTYTFDPNDAISRGEFITMLVKIFDLPLNYDGTGTFPDVYKVNPLTNGLYEYKYIETAARAGIVRGTTGGLLRPDSTLTREQAAVMIARTANSKLGTSAVKTLNNLLKLFTDANDINAYARASVEAVAKKGLIQGKENVSLPGQTKPTYSFDPKGTFTRAEAAAVAIRVLRMEKKIP